MSLSFIRTILGAALLGVGLLATAPAGADELAAIDPNARTGAAGWRVDGVTGEASAHRDAGAAAPLAVGQVLSAGSEVATGAGAVVFLSHNGDRMIIQPNSRLRIDEPGTAGLLDHFMQSLGSVFYDVEPRKSRSFGVTAPYVAAVIKGTRFLITVGPDKNSVRVDRGLVLVESTDGVSSVLVGAGTIAIAEPALARGVTLSTSGIPDATPTQATDLPGPVESLASATVGDSATTAVDGVTDAVGGAIDTVTDTAGGVVGGASDAVGGVAGGAADAVGRTADAAGNAAGAVAGAAGDTVSNAVTGAANVVGGAVNTVGGVVGGVTKGVGGALGGLLGGKK
jgi:FecR protein